MGAGARVILDAGQYRLDERLAASSYGEIWRAVRCADDEVVALKLVNGALMARADATLRGAWTEAAANEIGFLRALAPWDGRHIVRLLDSGRHAGLPALALELLGPDLGRHVAALREQGASVPIPQVLAWLAQVNQALARVHAVGWCYLDLKPANLLLHPHDASLRLTDFGTNRLRSAGPAAVYAGTASWQAPEAFFPGADGTYATSYRSDYFSLGALFYYLVTSGQVLAFCRACGAAWRADRHAAPAAMLARHGGMPPTLRDDEAQRFADLAGLGALDLLRALLAADPEMRPASALDISRMMATVRTPALRVSRAAPPVYVERRA